MDRAQLISEGYLKLQEKFHKESPDYGISGQNYAEFVQAIAASLGIETLLDYGAGKGTLREKLPMFRVHEYDPAIPEKSEEPKPHDFVVCTDVMEHIEPDKVDAVLDHIKSLARKVVFFQIATRPARKTMPDGRNAHINVRPKEYWLEKLMERWSLDQFQNFEGSLIASVSVR